MCRARYCIRPHRRRRWKAEELCVLRLQRADRLVGLIELRHHILADAADLKHLPAPALVLHVEEQHAGRIGIIRAVRARQHIVDVVLREHDLVDPCEQVRLMLLHPEDLRGRKSGKCDVAGLLRQLLPADHVIQVIGLLLRPSVVPENRRAENMIVLVEHDEAVHLAAGADARDL